MKHNLRNAMGRGFLSCVVLWAGTMVAEAQVEIDPISPAGTCISTSGTFSYTLSGTTGSMSGFTWSVLGDLEIVGGNTGTTVMVQSPSEASLKRKPYAKGRLCVTYTDTTLGSGCGNPTVCYDIYKEFTDNDLSIVGPSCISEDDTVTFSINSVVSFNLNQQIGIDSYTWSYSPGLVDDIIYYSGDSSSITFRAGAVTPGDSIFVSIGRCNPSFLYGKSVGQDIDTVQFVSGFAPPVCLEFDAEPIQLIFTPQADVTYSWDVGGWKVLSISALGDTLVLEPSSNNTQVLTLTATNSCGEKKFTYEIKRSLAEGGNIVVADTCLLAGQSVAFGVDVETAGTAMNWSVTGTGWAVQSGGNTANANILTGTGPGVVSVSTLSCPGVVYSQNVFIKPNAPGAISGNTSLAPCSIGNEVYSVAPVANATAYAWFYPAGWVTVGPQDSSAITLTPNGVTGGVIKVVAIGCGVSDTTYLNVAYNTVSLDSITASQPCVNVGMPDTLVFSAFSSGSGNYEWNIPAGLGTIIDYDGTGDSSRVRVATGGGEGNYFVAARIKTSCNANPWDSLAVSATGLTFDITTFAFGSFRVFSVDPDPVTGANYYSWFWNGSPNIDGVNETAMTIGGSPSSGTACVEVQNSGGCLTRKCYVLGSGFRQAFSDVAVESEKELTVYPNPASTELNISFDSEDEHAVYLVDEKGRILVNSKTSGYTQRINTSKLAAGTYYLLSRTNGKNSVKKVIIQK